MTWLYFVFKIIGWIFLAGFVVVVALVIFFILWLMYEQSQGRNPFA